MLILLLLLLLPASAWATNPGGFLQTQGSSTFQSRYSQTTINNFVPSTRSCFTFPAPYSTRGCRLTIPTDGTVNYVGYSYWANMNNHVADPDILIMLSLNTASSEGPTLFRFNKATETITKLGPIFPAGDNDRTNEANNGMYFSATLSTKLYWIDYAADRQILRRIDVLTQAITDVWNIRTTGVGSAGTCNGSSCPFAMIQSHTSVDDLTHVATLCTDKDNCLTTAVGCLVNFNGTIRFYADDGTGIVDECTVDKSGLYTVSFEKANAGAGSLNLHRVFNNSNGNLIDSVPEGAGLLGHSDTGYDYIVGADPDGAEPQQSIRYDFAAAAVTGPTTVHVNYGGPTNAWTINALNHISHLNAKDNTPLAEQWFCGSHSTSYNVSAYDINNDITCVRPDGTTTQLIVAPVMTDPTKTLCTNDQYVCQPKGNLDVTGQYFIWTSNLGGTRLDAMLVKIPSHLLVPEAPPDPPEDPPLGAGGAGSCHRYHVIRDREGNLVTQGAILHVYQAGTTNYAAVYDSPSCTTTKTNPLTYTAGSWPEAGWSFYAKDGIYDLIFTFRGAQFSPFYGVSLFGPGSTTFATLGAAANGTQLYCSDCTYNSNPCTGGSTGAFAKGVNGVWRCD